MFSPISNRENQLSLLAGSLGENLADGQAKVSISITDRYFKYAELFLTISLKEGSPCVRFHCLRFKRNDDIALNLHHAEDK
ncbi:MULTISPECIES: hypothetical protein [Xenorhabdus]|uniref:hypothetical protein n=1 Tax=Xenorhabdus TaxID=626 RepID=UPI000E75ED3C|nr:MULTISPECIES: hypothetical protein [Xenorhabdus]MBC8950338.1 hypothetical protein [Xenorhabdus sp. TS4]